MFHLSLLVLLFPLSLISMHIPLPRGDEKSLHALKVFESNPKIRRLENMIDVCILKHLVTPNSNGPLLLQEAVWYVKNFFLVNKALCRLRANNEINAYLLEKLTLHYRTEKITAASYLATPGARAYLTGINQSEKSAYMDALKNAAMVPAAFASLKGLITCDATGLAFQGLPRITALMIAVGYKNEAAVDILIAAAKKRNILSSYLNMQCPEGTSTYREEATDGEFIFFCSEDSTALHVASANSNKVPLNIMEKLLASGANPNPKTATAPSPLARAIMHSQNNFSRASLLLKYHADPDFVLKNWKNLLSKEEMLFLDSCKRKIA